MLALFSGRTPFTSVSLLAVDTCDSSGPHDRAESTAPTEPTGSLSPTTYQLEGGLHIPKLVNARA